MGRIRDFRDLRVYREASLVAGEIFYLTKGFPPDEYFIQQIRRCSRSVPANIAEAWRRRRYPAAFVSKLNDAEAEAAETRAHLDTALLCGYVSRAVHRRLDAAYERITGQLVRMIQGAEDWAVGTATTPTARRRPKKSPTSPAAPQKQFREPKTKSRDESPPAKNSTASPPRTSSRKP